MPRLSLGFDGVLAALIHMYDRGPDMLSSFFSYYLSHYDPNFLIGLDVTHLLLKKLQNPSSRHIVEYSILHGKISVLGVSRKVAPHC